MRCAPCRSKHLHQTEAKCIALHCSICGMGSSLRWWSYGLWTSVCGTCLAECPADISEADMQRCPVPGCDKKAHLRNKSLDHSGFCSSHMLKQPNQMQFTMLRLKLLLQQLLCHMGRPDISYKREVWEKLWPLTKFEAEGGLTNPVKPHAPWCLLQLRDQLMGRCTELDGGTVAWKTCPAGGSDGGDRGRPSKKRGRQSCAEGDSDHHKRVDY